MLTLAALLLDGSERRVVGGWHVGPDHVVRRAIAVVAMDLIAVARLDLLAGGVTLRAGFFMLPSR